MMDQGIPPLGDCVAERALHIMEGMLDWRPHIEEALERANWSHTFDDITYMVIGNILEFHNFDDCFCLTQQTVFPQFKTYHFMLAGGDIEAIIDKTEHFKRKARELECKYLSFSGRKGFEPVLKREGWEHKFTTMWLEV